MPKILLSLDEESTDIRDSEVAFKFTVQNSGTVPIQILALSPRLPESARLLEIKDFSASALNTQYIQLCEELSQIANDVLLVTDTAHQKAKIQILRDGLNQVVGELSWNYFSMILKLMTGVLQKQIADALKRDRAISLRIETLADAQRADADFVSKSTADDIIKRLFAAKIAQLAILDQKLDGKSVKDAALARLEADSVFSATYIVRFPRNWANSAQYNIAVEATYHEDNKPLERHNAMASRTLRISPKPLTLSLIAMLSSVMGVALRHTLDQGTATAAEILTLDHIFPPQDLIPALILALVFFNVFEFTDVLKEARKNLGWRTALLIGVFCGLGSERIVEAFKKIIGA